MPGVVILSTKIHGIGLYQRILKKMQVSPFHEPLEIPVTREQFVDQNCPALPHNFDRATRSVCLKTGQGGVVSLVLL